MYDDVVNENVPDDFLSFLEEADERISGSAAPDSPETQSDQAEDSARKKA